MSAKEQKRREASNRRRAERELDKMEEEKNAVRSSSHIYLSSLSCIQVIAQLLNKTAQPSLAYSSPELKFVSGPTNLKLIRTQKMTKVIAPSSAFPPFLFGGQSGAPRTHPQKCSVKSCKNTKRYNHARLNLPVCSLACYKILSGSE